MAAKPKTLFTELSKGGPHKVLRGDLSHAGLSGVVFTPESGVNLPAVVFAHDWLTGVKRYHKLLTHLASWGIVAAAPDTERGPLASQFGLAADIHTAIEIVTGVRLGTGTISVHPQKIGLVGHGFGASAAIRTCAQNLPVKSFVALYPSPTKPPAEPLAATLTMPSLIIAGEDDVNKITSNAVPLAQAWGGPTILRNIKNADGAELAEGFSLRGFLGGGDSDRKTQSITRALLTGYLLYQLTKNKKYEAFADSEIAFPKSDVVASASLATTPQEQLTRLLR
ncbi:MAG: dienelactone hydrolase family protein [Mycobacteriaceae bacterium]